MRDYDEGKYEFVSNLPKNNCDQMHRRLGDFNRDFQFVIGDVYTQ